MPGAGSNKAAAYMYAVAAKDGTSIGAIFPGAVVEPLLGDKSLVEPDRAERRSPQDQQGPRACPGDAEEPSDARQDGRAAHHQLRENRRAAADPRTGLRPARVRPSLRAAAGRSGRARDGVAPRL